MITAKMMWIADHPSNPWLEESYKLQGWTVFKYGEAKLVTKKTEEWNSKSSGPAEVKPQKIDHHQNLIQHLAKMVKEETK